MNLALTDDQRMIREAAESFLAEAAASAAVRKAGESAEGFDAAVWRQIGGELGWCGTAIAEEHGGLGMGPRELVLIVEQMGRRLLPGPFFGTVCLAGTLVAEAGSRDACRRYLPEIAAGKFRATVAFDADEVKAKKVKAGWLLTGTFEVADGALADQIFVVSGGRAFAVSAGAKGFSAKPLDTWDVTRRRARVTLRGVEAQRIDDAGRKDGVARARALAQLYVAAEQLGGAQQCLDLVVRYTSERKQFGRAIASFQAVKHRCAAMMVQVEGLRSAVYGAAAAAAERPDVAALERECAMAKALASDAFFHCAGEAVQLHGGVGFTTEFDPQLYFKRAQAGTHWLGTPDALREQIASALLG